MNFTKKQLRLYLLIILGVTILLYLPTFTNNFVNLDDDKQVYKNAEVLAAPSVENTEKIFSSYYLNMYQPLVTLSFNIEHSTFGLNPEAFHSISLLFHLINILLVFWLFRLFFKRDDIPLAIAFLFAIHPLGAEVVGWVSARSTAMYFSFFLLSLIFYVFYLEKKKAVFLVVCILAFVVSLFCKVMAVSLPLLLFAIDYYYKRKFTLKTFLEKIPFLLLAVYFIHLALEGRGEFVSRIGHSRFELWDSIFIVPYQIQWYLIKFFFPFQLSAFYNDPRKLTAAFYLAPVIIGLIVWAVIRARKNRKILIFGLALFLLPLFPIIKILPIGHTLVADRYMYFSMLGLLFIFGSYYKNINPDRVKYLRVFRGIAIFFVLIFFIISSERIRTWENTETMWNSVHKGNKKYGLGWFNLANQKKKEKRYEEALADYDKAIKYSKNYWKAYHNRGNTKGILKDYEGAIADYTETIRIKPDYVKSIYARGYYYLKLKNYNRALIDFNRVIELDPYHPNAWHKRGQVKRMKKDYAGALNDYNKALKITSNNAYIWRQRGTLKQAMNNLEGAIEDFEKSLEIKPENNSAKAMLQKVKRELAASN